MTGSGGRGDRSHDTLTNLVLAPREHDRFLRSPSAGSLVSGNKCSRHLGEWRQPATTSTRRFPANQIPTLRFHALLNREAPEVNLMLA
jgi:hypothetical protein